MQEFDVDQGELEHLAYEFWVQRGRPMGSPEEDWFEAERALGAIHFSGRLPFTAMSLGPLEY